MPKKRAAESPYDPIAADLAREVVAAGRVSHNPTGGVAGHQTTPPLQPEEPGSGPGPITRARPPVPEPRITKRFVLSRAEDDDVNAFILRLQQAAQTKVPLSVIVRALLWLAMKSEPTVVGAVADRVVRLPSTHDAVALGHFEESWSQILGLALRHHRPPQ